MTKILIATGGTGGHIYPALVTAEELKRRGHDVRFIGVFGPAGETLKARGFSCVAIRARGFVAKGPVEKLFATIDMIGALVASGRAVLSFAPDVVVGFGGYSSFPTVVAARVFGRRALIHEQNVLPGLANRILAKAVPRVCVGFRDSLRYFPKGKAVWTGMPFRPLHVTIDRVAAARRFGLDPSKKILLVFGGSQGAHRINGCVVEMLQTFPKAKNVQVIHATGEDDFPAMQAKYAALSNASFVQAFIENIDEAYAACDTVVARAGAGTVTELGALGIPAVLIPYPGAKNHQLMNAKVLARAGGASIIEEKSLSSDILGAKIFEMIERKASRRDLKGALKGEFIPDPERRLADEVERLAGISK